MAILAATPISAWMMASGPWLPFLVSLGITIVSTGFAFFIPETLWEVKAKLAACEATDDEDNRSDTMEPTTTKYTVVGTIASRAREFIQSTEFMWKNVNVVLSLLILFVGNTDRQSLSLLIQYAAAKYHWSIARVRLLPHF